MLITCHECAGKVSDQAPACPHCGAPPRSATAASPTRPPSGRLLAATPGPAPRSSAKSGLRGRLLRRRPLAPRAPDPRGLSLRTFAVAFVVAALGFGALMASARVRAGARPDAPGVVAFVLANAALPALVVALVAVELRKLVRWRGKTAALVVVAIIGAALVFGLRWITAPPGGPGLLDLAGASTSRIIMALPALVTWFAGHVVALAVAMPADALGAKPEHVVLRGLIVFVAASLNASITARALFPARPVAREGVAA